MPNAELMRTRVKQTLRRISPGFMGWLELKRMEQRVMNGRFWQFVPEQALEAKFGEALDWLCRRDGPRALGDYLEFGVYYGTSLACMHRALQSRNIQGMRLFGFDSFQGLPGNAAYEDDRVWAPGEFASSIDLTHKYLRKAGVDPRRLTLTKGWFDQTLTPDLIQEHRIEKASIIMVDCDLYSSAKLALRFSTDLIKDEAVILFDDWNSGKLAEKGLGEKKAFDEWLRENPYFSCTEVQNYCPNSMVMKISRLG